MPGRPKKQAKTISTWKLFGDPEFWETAFKLMAAGESTTVICGTFNVTTNGFMNRIKSDPDLFQRFEQARENRANWHAERIENIINDVDAGIIDAHAAKVSIDARKWLASRMDPNSWGDKTRVDLNVTDVTQLHLEAIRELGMPESYTEDSVIAEQ
tara:strand:- start:105 stop:572 length:468 start_codon:yes stop_codon:yes gene_type:complete